MAEAEESGIKFQMKTASFTGYDICDTARKISDMFRAGSLIDRSKRQFSKFKELQTFLFSDADGDVSEGSMDIEPKPET